MRIIKDLATKQQNNAPAGAADESLSNKIITPATGLTVLRPMLAGKAAGMLLRGERYVTPVVAVMAATDMEGYVARFIDKIFPEWGRGTTEFGMRADKYADVAGLAIVAAAALKAPRVSMAGKVAAGAVIAQQSLKAVWAARVGMEYGQATGEVLDLPPSKMGKQGIFEQFVGVTAAVATNDTDSWAARRSLDAVALGTVGVGTMHTRSAIRDYGEIIPELLERAQLEATTAGLAMPEVPPLIP